MKKGMAVGLWLGLLSSLQMSEAEDYTQYRKADEPARPVELVNPGFDQGKTGWSLGKEYSLDPSGGRNGSGALKCERASADEYSLATQDVRLTPGDRCRFSVWVRVDDIALQPGKKRAGAKLALEFYDSNGKFLSGGGYSSAISDTQRKWVYVSGNVTVPDKTATGRIMPYLSKGLTGTAWFDDIEVVKVAPRRAIYFVKPAFERITTEDGTITLRVYSESKLEHRYQAYLLVKAGDQTHESIAKINDGYISADLGTLPAGSGELTVKVVDPQEKVIVAGKTLPFTIVPAHTDIPPYAVQLDRDGDLLVDGKSYFPVGVYAGQLYKDKVDHLANSPFNCVMSYCATFFTLNKGDTPSRETIRETLDYCHKKKLKVIFHGVGRLPKSVDPVTGVTKGGHSRWMGAEGREEVVRAIVNEYKEHPALLVWYTADEVPISMIDHLVKNRRLINQLDPFHPTWGVFFQAADFPLYGEAFDIHGIDSYPYQGHLKTKPPRLDKVARACAMMKKSGLPFWAVPQIWNSGEWAYHKNGNNIEDYEKYLEPTEGLMRSNALLEAINGAKGFVFYAEYVQEWAPTKEDYDRQWKRACRVGQLFRDLEPFILSKTPSPKIDIEKIKGKVQAREFRDRSGRIRILTCAIGPDASEAIITTTSSKELKSLYGKCESLGNGQYRFKSDGVDSDVLAGD